MVSRYLYSNRSWDYCTSPEIEGHNFAVVQLRKDCYLSYCISDKLELGRVIIQIRHNYFILDRLSCLKLRMQSKVFYEGKLNLHTAHWRTMT